MISRHLAEALRDAGLEWTPTKGDLFLVPDRDMDDVVFALSDMVIDKIERPGRPPLLAFNGTTEWALDNLMADEALWLPREHQLRDLLGDAFESLERVAEPMVGYVVTSGGERHVDVSADDAYARALLTRL